MSIKNAPMFLELAETAGKAWDSSDKNAAKGEAYAIAALVAAWDSFDFTYTVERKKDERDAPVTITIPQLFDEPRNADGSKDTKAIGARKVALLQSLFRISEPSNAHMSKLNRALLSARYLVNAKADVRIVNGQLRVPFGMVEAPPKDNASSKAKVQYEAMKDKLVSIDGKEGMSLNALRACAASTYPTAKRATRNSNANVGTSLAASIKFVRAAIETQLTDNGESDVAMSPTLRRELYLLTQSAAQYFSADPIGDDADLDFGQKVA